MLQVRGIIGGSPLLALSGLYSPISNWVAPIATICRVTASLVLSTSRVPGFIVETDASTRKAAGLGDGDVYAADVPTWRETPAWENVVFWNSPVPSLKPCSFTC